MPSRSPVPRPVVRVVLAAVLLAMSGALAGCGGAGDIGVLDAASAEARGQAGPSLRTTTTVRKVSGRLPVAERRALARRITAVVDAWFDDAFVGGRFPRARFGSAFSSFTRPAARRAREDRAIMSNGPLGPRLAGVRATQRQLRLDVLAPGGVVAAVTADVSLRMQLELRRGSPRRDHVRGDLYLTRSDGRWRVFGYQVDRKAAR